MNSDTIAAIATAMSPSGIGIIRISGEDTLDIIDRIYRSKMERKKSVNAKVIQYIMDIFMMRMKL